MRVCIGGTFNKFHKGHKKLINKAITIAGENGFIFIGIAVGKIIENKKYVRPFENRKEIIEDFLKSNNFLGKVSIAPIYDKFGPSIVGNFDAIVVSPETIRTAEEINYHREKLNKKTLKIFQIPFVLSEDKRPISSTRILNKEIDENGNIIYNV